MDTFTGSFIVPREVIMQIGDGSLQAGHKALDDLCVAMNEQRRAQTEAWNAMSPQERTKFILALGGIVDGVRVSPGNADAQAKD